MSLPPLTVREIVDAIHVSRRATFCRHSPSNTLVQPLEVWLPESHMWVNLNGRRASAPLRGMIQPGFLGRLRIRAAWRRRNHPIKGLL